MRVALVPLACCLFILTTYGQPSPVILGAGHGNISVTTSSELSMEGWQQIAGGDKTISAQGLDDPLYQASRFLAQSTFGANEDLIEQVAQIGFETWIDDQMSLPMTDMQAKIDETFTEVSQWHLLNGGDSSEIPDRPNWIVFNYAWWDANMRNQDLLRQRVAFALSEIFVISVQSDLEGYGDGLANFYNVLSRHAFGNYRDLLRDVSLHPCMGFYLSHLNNPKTDVENNTRPDENYAREIMQLFSIGLYELNADGTRKHDNDGHDIPTYGQTEIKEMAKIWTGLSVAGVIPNMYDEEPYFGIGIYTADMTLPMKMYEEYHEPGEKHLVGGITVPAGQTGMGDIESAIDVLFNHPNVGPFISRRLIQRLIKSNPTPLYIERVAKVFDDNGSGVRGDLGAVVKAILLDPEARDCDELSDESSGMLREPFVRYSHFARALNIEQYYDRYWNACYSFWESTGQSVMAAKSVFNFFLPDFQPNGPIAEKELVAPEFQIHNSRTSIGMINEINRWAVYNVVMYGWEENNPEVILDIDDLKDYARDPEVLINKLDILFTHGQLTQRTRDIIKEAIDAQIYGDYRANRVRLAIYLIMISPDYAILK
ncbi:MAG: DUF1800 domain-containing protein [Saprospiraceae bacterium]|nr:DUF1800 domain-containing protein [Saprospiraceae bacterium]